VILRPIRRFITFVPDNETWKVHLKDSTEGRRQKMQLWKQRRYWIQAGKYLIILVPIMALYAVLGTQGLLAFCSSHTSSPLWCRFGFVVYGLIAIAIARVIDVWLRPRDAPRRTRKT